MQDQVREQAASVGVEPRAAGAVAHGAPPAPAAVSRADRSSTDRGRTPRLALEGLSHAYGGTVVLDGIDLTVAPGEIVALLGPSGCGKTTLLRIAAGIEEHRAGRILLDGVEISGPGRFVPAEERSLGLVFQDFALFPHLTVLANVMFGIRGVARSERARRARTLLERVGLADRADAFPHALSGGQQQRVALVRALAPNPRVLLLDEPFSGLDEALREDVRRETLALLKEREATAVIVTHDPEEALGVADRIAVMRDGRILEIASPRELYFRPRTVFGASLLSRLDLFAGTVRDGGVATPLGRVPCPDIGEGRSVTVAVRPHDIDVSIDAGVPAVVTSAVFLGDRTRLTLAVPGHERPLLVDRPGEVDARPGQEVRLAIRSGRALVFART